MASHRVSWRSIPTFAFGSIALALAAPAPAQETWSFSIGGSSRPQANLFFCETTDILALPDIVTYVSQVGKDSSGMTAGDLYDLWESHVRDEFLTTSGLSGSCYLLKDELGASASLSSERDRLIGESSRESLRVQLQWTPQLGIYGKSGTLPPEGVSADVPKPQLNPSGPVTYVETAVPAPPKGFSEWNRYWRMENVAPWVTVYYATKVDKNEVRVIWLCHNASSRNISCSVGAGRDKQYSCWKGMELLGETGALGERATVRKGSYYAFPTDWPCRGLGATSAEPRRVAISIE